MKIELKNIKHIEHMSEETNCFTASIYINDKRAGEVSNRGQGASHDYHPRDLWEKLNAHAQTLPSQTWTLNDQPLEIKPCPDTIVDELMTNHLVGKDLKRAMSKRILFMRDGEMLETARNLDRVTLARHLSEPEKLRQQLKTDIIFNLMPLADAVTFYRKKGA